MPDITMLTTILDDRVTYEVIAGTLSGSEFEVAERLAGHDG